jgi:predicted lipoprotein
MNRIALGITLAFVAAGVVWRFPLFYVVPLAQAEAERNEARFDARRYAEIFWETRLAPHLAEADDALAVLEALRDRPQRAREQYGHQVGISRTAYYFVRGSAMILEVDRKGVAAALAADAGPADILLATGPVIGSAVRDATGLLRSGDFSNSQHFNELAGELNRLAEAGPIERLKRGARPGRRVEFVGCAAITADNVPRPLKVTPVDVVYE